jgi:predicted outer membrane protein
MHSKSKLATLFAVSSLVLAGAVAPAVAASPMSNAFVANARANVDFLDSSSRLALTQSSNPRIRAFAHQEARDETIVSNSLVAFASTNGQIVVGQTYVGDGPLAPVVGAAVLPLDVATTVTTSVGNNVDAVLSGRSVAIDDPLTPRVVTPQAYLPASTADLDRLRGLQGREFDALYRSTQRNALSQLATLYRDYLQNGDDEALRAIARSELPKINRDLRELSAI